MLYTSVTNVDLFDVNPTIPFSIGKSFGLYLEISSPELNYMNVYEFVILLFSPIIRLKFEFLKECGINGVWIFLDNLFSYRTF